MEWAMMGSLNNYPDQLVSGRVSRNTGRRKSSIVLPQVSFEQPSSDSTEVVKKGGNRKASMDVTSSEATTSLMVSRNFFHSFVCLVCFCFRLTNVMES